MFVPFNINDTVRVKLTEHGKQIHRERLEQICEYYKINLKYDPIIEDENGWSRFQMHRLMWIFGNHMDQTELPFATNIEMWVDDLKISEDVVRAHIRRMAREICGHE